MKVGSDNGDQEEEGRQEDEQRLEMGRVLGLLIGERGGAAVKRCTG